MAMHIEFKQYTDDEFFNHKVRGANNVVNAIFGSPTDVGGKYANIPPSILEAAANRGKAVHEAIEKWLKKNMEGPLELGLEHDVYRIVFEEWLDERTEILEIIAIELKIISEQLGLKGVIDFIGKFRNKETGEEFYALVDWKTSSSLDEFRTQCQLTLYYFLLMEQYPELADKMQQLRCLQLTKNAYRWFKFPIDIKLGQSMLYLYDNFFRANAEKGR